MYQGYEVKESDWKLFRKKISGWQENYMGKLVHEYIDMLSDDEKNPSDRFWTLEKRIKADKRDVGVIAEMSRSKMYGNLIGLIDEGAITLDDLSEFSEELQEKLRFVFRENRE